MSKSDCEQDCPADKRRFAASASRSAVARWLTSGICLLTACTLCGCASGLLGMSGMSSLADRFSKQDEESPSSDSEKGKSLRRQKEEDNDFGNRIETPLLSEYMSVQGNTAIVLRGVGLVTGLDGTGGDPSPSALRTQLQTEMSRRNVKNTKEVLASRDTALVVVTAYLPAMVRKGQHFDVRVALPPNSNAKSLKGGWLLETRLFEEQNIDGRGTLKGHEYAIAGGAILTGLTVHESREERQGQLMSGTIPGGAISLTDRDLSIVLRTEKRGIRNSERVASAVSSRFFRYNKFGQRTPCATAKTDALVELKTHDKYINNFPRYQSVIRNLALSESDVARRLRMETLARDILDPERCQSAALQLEAIGDDAIPFLRDALKSDSFEVRFQAAQSLAYLGNPSGVAVLTEAVATQPAFRIYGLVALSVIDDADAVIELRNLMNAESLETRYGAFRALKELDPRDPSLHPVVFENHFVMYVVDSQGVPMAHVTRRRAPEVVLFGANQSFRLPVMLNAGRNIRVKGEAASDEIEVTFYELNAEPRRERVPNRLVEIVRACGEFGATYPDVVQMMIEAEQQHNFTGEFGIDRLPQAGRLYLKRDEWAEEDKDAKRIGNPHMIPELFDELDEDELKGNESSEKLMSLNFEAVTRQDEKAAIQNSAAMPQAPSTAPAAPEGSILDEGTGLSEPAAATDAISAVNPSEIVAQKQDSESVADSGESPDDFSELSETAGKPAGSWFGSGFFDRIRKPFGGLSEPGAEP